MELSYNQLSYLLRRYPKFEPSYETMSQKGDLNNYNICMAIPNGKKVFGSGSNGTVSTEGAAFTIVFTGNTHGWKITEK